MTDGTPFFSDRERRQRLANEKAHAHAAGGCDHRCSKKIDGKKIRCGDCNKVIGSV
jgi:hypothetical protein